VKANVFGFGIAPPSISVEEFGDMEKQEAEMRSQRQKETTEQTAHRRYKDLLAAGDEDDEDLEDQVSITNFYLRLH
jgi:hypothetical protein